MSPKILEPILAEIYAITELGESRWFEVIYWDGEKWQSFAGSKTFEDGETVLRWIYAKECFNISEVNK